MFGKVHLFAAAVAFAVAGSTAASAGVIDGTRWGPVHWSCASDCGPMPTVFYGPAVEPIYYYRPQRVYRVNQGPVYQAPILAYGEPPVAPEPDPRLYPYVYPYGGYTFSGGHRHHRYTHRQVSRMPMVRRTGRWHN